MPLRCVGMDVRRVVSIWRIMMNPHDTQMKDISNVFFDSITNVSNMRYIHAQQTSVDHWVEERNINLTFHDDDEVMLEGDERDVA